MGGAPENHREAMDEVIDWLSFYNHRRQALETGPCRPDAV
jgi:hypothetical protein